MQPPQQVLEQLIGFVLVNGASTKGAAKRRRYSGLVGQAFNTDDTPVHVMLGRRLPHVSFAGHLSDLTQVRASGFAFSAKSGRAWPNGCI